MRDDPISFPGNYANEAFYQLASGTLSTANAGKAVIELNLEQAFSTGPVVPGDQITFSRLRFTITKTTDGVP